MIENVRDNVSHRAETVRNETSAFFWILRTAMIVAVAGAIYTELRKDPDKRTWNGKLLDVIPYDFRLPTLVHILLAIGAGALAGGLWAGIAG